MEMAISYFQNAIKTINGDYALLRFALNWPT